MFINQKIIKFSILLFCFNIFSSISQTNEDVPLNNIAINEIPTPISPIIFEDFSDNKINLKDYTGKLVIINFWAVWCEPCKKEMPSLDRLQINSNLDNLQIFAINISQENKKKVDDFFNDLGIKNFEPFYDAPKTLAKTFSLRGVPTSILINKKGEEFARILGSIEFDDIEFINWLENYN